MKENKKLQFALLAILLVVLFLVSTIVIVTAMERQAALINDNLSSISLDVWSINIKSKKEEKIDDFLSIYEASTYLNLEVDEIDKFIQNGDMKGTYIVDSKGKYSFSRDALKNWFILKSK